MAKIEPCKGSNTIRITVAMPRPVRSTRNTRVNYAESVCSDASDNDSDYSPDEFAAVAVQQEGTRRSTRLKERTNAKPVVKKSSRSYS